MTFDGTCERGGGQRAPREIGWSPPDVIASQRGAVASQQNVCLPGSVHTLVAGQQGSSTHRQRSPRVTDTHAAVPAGAMMRQWCLPTAARAPPGAGACNCVLARDALGYTPLQLRPAPGFRMRCQHRGLPCGLSSLRERLACSMFDVGSLAI
jgi:hypothetical protein